MIAGSTTADSCLGAQDTRHRSLTAAAVALLTRQQQPQQPHHWLRSWYYTCRHWINVSLCCSLRKWSSSTQYSVGPCRIDKLARTGKSTMMTVATTRTPTRNGPLYKHTHSPRRRRTGEREKKGKKKRNPRDTLACAARAFSIFLGSDRVPRNGTEEDQQRTKAEEENPNQSKNEKENTHRLVETSGRIESKRTSSSLHIGSSSETAIIFIVPKRQILTSSEDGGNGK